MQRKPNSTPSMEAYLNVLSEPDRMEQSLIHCLRTLTTLSPVRLMQLTRDDGVYLSSRTPYHMWLLSRAPEKLYTHPWPCCQDLLCSACDTIRYQAPLQESNFILFAFTLSLWRMQKKNFRTNRVNAKYNRRLTNGRVEQPSTATSCSRQTTASMRGMPATQVAL